ncbi:MAG: 2-oxo acid dehydrogenase subunit E2 [Candidatus Margulisbacteria bacterium]|nr:2-oxo acid dehydrogenase subunit E2 [Candidatus Margulisiibacteriota bacterium]
MNITIPFLGDGIESANVVSILVKPGDSVAVDQTLIELETDKATAPVPSLFDGIVDQISVKEGDVVKEGMLVVTLAGDALANQPNKPKDTIPIAPPVQQVQPLMNATPPTSPTPLSPVAPISLPDNIFDVKTSPSIIKFACLSGLDITKIQPTGTGNRLTWDDIKAYLAHCQHALNKTDEPKKEEKTAKKPTIDFASFGPIKKQKLTSLRQKISNHLTSAWQDIPHVTQFSDISINTIMTIRKEANAGLKKGDIKLSVTVFILKAIAETLKDHPTFNSSLVNDELIIKEYIHLGVAVDTETGLVVPVIKDADKKSLQTIAQELDNLATKARDKQLAVKDIQGATFTLSNLGGLGASHFTPIVNSPEVAILGTGAATNQPEFNNGEWTPSLKMPVALSYDHRVIDGADGARFVQTLTKNIEQFDKKWVK